MKSYSEISTINYALLINIRLKLSTNRGDYTVRGNPKMFLFSSRLFSSVSCSSLALSWENSHCYELFFFKVI